MRISKFGPLCAVGCILLTSGLFAQNTNTTTQVGTTVAQFLKIGAGARAIGLGGTFTALADDISSIYWNPAGMAVIGGKGEATFNHAEWLAETQYDFVAFSLNAGNFGSIGFHAISFRTPQQPVRTVFDPEGTGQVWDYNAISLGASYARQLTDRFSIGFTAKFIQENIFNESAKGGAFDIGVLYETPFENLTLGAAITNFGTKMRLNGRDIFFNEDPLAEAGPVDEVPAEFRLESFDIPLNLRFGLAWKVVNSEQTTIMALVDGSQPNDNSESVNGGIEIGLKNVLFVRGGYRSLFLDNSEQGATFGLGLRYDVVGTNIRIDYGWADYGRLKNVQFVSLGIRY